jgi:hypothetical protein
MQIKFGLMYRHQIRLSQPDIFGNEQGGRIVSLQLDRESRAEPAFQHNTNACGINDRLDAELAAIQEGLVWRLLPLHEMFLDQRGNITNH